MTPSPARLLRFAVLGDVEPKPEPIFDNFRSAVAAVNLMAAVDGIDFTVCIGDLAHQGKTEQYEIVTEILVGLKTPVYAIMGNEELSESVERFLQYAARWNDGVKGDDGIPGIAYVKERAGLTFIFATAERNGRTFSEAEIDWIERHVDERADSPVFLFTHAPAPELFPVPHDRTVANGLLKRVTARPNVVAVFSGHTHLDLDSVHSYTRDEHGVHHIHVPGIERTKVGPTHTPRFRVVTIDDEGRVLIQTYNVDLEDFEERHQISFTLPMH